MTKVELLIYVVKISSFLDYFKALFSLLHVIQSESEQRDSTGHEKGGHTDYKLHEGRQICEELS